MKKKSHRSSLSTRFIAGVVFVTCTILALGITLCAPTARAAAVSDDPRMYWEPVSQALVKVDDKTPLRWNVYQPSKSDKPSGKEKDKENKRDPEMVLVLIGRRYLLLDIKGKLVYGVQLADLQAKGPNFESAYLLRADRIVPSSDWGVRDIGPAESIHLTLGDYGAILDVQVAHPPDMRAFY
jgi:hypothetical protein